MLFSLLFSASLAHAGPNEVFQHNFPSHSEFQDKMQKCATLHGWDQCYQVIVVEFGTTGKERVEVFLEGIGVTMESTPREVTFSESRLLTYSIDLDAPIRGYALVDIDGDRVEDLVFEDTNGERWVVPYEADRRP